jgi:hypothetical protein
VDVRNMACFVVEQLLHLVGPQLSHEARRALYPELVKRLDDSSNQVGHQVKRGCNRQGALGNKEQQVGGMGQ